MEKLQKTKKKTNQYEIVELQNYRSTKIRNKRYEFINIDENDKHFLFQ